MAVAMIAVACSPQEDIDPLPTLPPRPPGSTSAPQPVVTRPPEHDLALISSNCTTRSDIGFTECEGYVQNISGGTLENVMVVIEWFDADGTPQSADEALIDYNPILAGQQSPWSTIGRYNPALTTFSVQFKDLLGPTLRTRDDTP